ncbi:hypothetical protein GN244_ATG01580 [Phytophthora infestans]|uniref:Uncharacterized protein n=1 Tax=Phytophthora infestans TaxID=4787 RepID=A0A833SUB4_PHYIN|nr:hypothetical protein GN244_ATG01580 [Phytophthora infestans]KAF4131034.1 hypothetical protein GN958_ATG19766 [Phytophthora infestans]
MFAAGTEYISEPAESVAKPQYDTVPLPMVQAVVEATESSVATPETGNDMSSKSAQDSSISAPAVLLVSVVSNEEHLRKAASDVVAPLCPISPPTLELITALQFPP